MRHGKVYLRRHVSIFFQVNVPGRAANGNRDERIAKAVLSGTTVHETDMKSLAEIARAFRAQAAEVKRGRDPSFAACSRIVSLLPWRLVRGFLNLVSWLIYGLNLDLGFLGLPQDPFGSVMITNVGGMGIDVAWAPLVPYTRVPLLLAVGTIRDKVVADNGEAKVRPVLSIGVTFDHRLIDGVHAAQMSDEFKRCFAEPAKYSARGLKQGKPRRLYNSDPSAYCMTMLGIRNPVVWLIGVSALGIVLFLARAYLSAETRARRREKSHRPVVSHHS